MAKFQSDGDIVKVGLYLNSKGHYKGRFGLYFVWLTCCMMCVTIQMFSIFAVIRSDADYMIAIFTEKYNEPILVK